MMGKRRHLPVFEICLFAMLGAILFGAKMIMEFLPNIHPVGMLTMVFTLVFRKKALIPLYLFVFLNGIYAGFNLWWVPYLYIWTILWGITMLLPRNMPKKAAMIVYPAICALHGLAFGILYAPAQAILFGLNFEEMILWAIAGTKFDLLHMVGNLGLGLMILPLKRVLERLLRRNG